MDRQSYMILHSNIAKKLRSVNFNDSYMKQRNEAKTHTYKILLFAKWIKTHSCNSIV